MGDTTKREGCGTRRDFLKGAGCLGASAAILGLTGCSAGSNSENPTSSISWDEEYDVIVVGAGAAGAATAVEISRLDENATCLLAEKGAAASGCTPYSGGIMIWTKEPDEALSYLKALTKGHTPDDVLSVFAEGLTELPDWLRSMGLADEDFGFILDPDVTQGATAEHPELEGCDSLGLIRVGNGFGSNKDDSGKPQHVHELLMSQVEASDTIEYRTNSAVDALIQDPATKTIIGVVIEGKNVKANKGVVMTCGGFEHNEDMIATFLGSPYAHSYAGPGNTGDGIVMCQKIGASFWHMNACAGFWMGGRDLDNTAFTLTNFDADTRPKQFGITVGINGRRFYMDYDSVMNNCGSDVPNGYALHSDASIHVGSRHGYQQYGGEWTHLPLPEISWFIFDSDALAKGAIDPATSTDPLADNLVVTANSIEELAALIEVPADELVSTVAQWNRLCEEGHDSAFYRPDRTMTPITVAPFYAQLCAPAMLNTDGGPKRSAKAEILDPDGNPIPCLYSAGEFGSLWSGTYQGGGNVSECVVFGRIAAKNVLENA